MIWAWQRFIEEHPQAAFGIATFAIGVQLGVLAFVIMRIAL